MQTALLSSLPDGTRVIYMSPASSPVFQIRFCQRLSSKHGEAPIKTLPRDCWRYAAKGYPCSCGTITYIGSPFSFTPSPPPPPACSSGGCTLSPPPESLAAYLFPCLRTSLAGAGLAGAGGRRV